VLQRHALADGIMEAAVARVVEELRRPKTMIFQDNIDLALGSPGARSTRRSPSGTPSSPSGRL
jgi:hypothetical protein